MAVCWLTNVLIWTTLFIFLGEAEANLHYKRVFDTLSTYPTGGIYTNSSPYAVPTTFVTQYPKRFVISFSTPNQDIYYSSTYSADASDTTELIVANNYESTKDQVVSSSLYSAPLPITTTTSVPSSTLTAVFPDLTCSTSTPGSSGSTTSATLALSSTDFITVTQTLTTTITETTNDPSMTSSTVPTTDGAAIIYMTVTEYAYYTDIYTVIE
ncbi:hypothetical protein V1511DRAFT_509338 [Dipodascopsis uninucleata]